MTDRPAPMHVSPMVAVADLARSRRFYEDLLGLDGSPVPGGWALAADHGTLLTLLQVDSRADDGERLVATIRVDDVPSTVRELRRRGVPFLDAEESGFAVDEDGVSGSDGDLQVAWLRDPDGNVLTVFTPGDQLSVRGDAGASPGTDNSEAGAM